VKHWGTAIVNPNTWECSRGFERRLVDLWHGQVVEAALEAAAAAFEAEGTADAPFPPAAPPPLCGAGRGGG